MATIKGAVNDVVSGPHGNPTTAAAAHSAPPLVHGFISALAADPKPAAPSFISAAPGSHVSIFAAGTDGGAPSLAFDQSNPGEGATSLFGQPTPMADPYSAADSAALSAATVNVAGALADSSVVGTWQLGGDSLPAAAGNDLLTASPAGGASDPAAIDPAGIKVVEANGLTVTFQSAEHFAKSLDIPHHDK